MSKSDTSNISADQDPDFIRQAIDEANVNVLRIALYQQTKDPALADMKIEKYTRPGVPFIFTVVAEEHHQVVRDKVFDYLTSERKNEFVKPSKEEVGKLMENFAGQEFSESEVEYGWEELAFDSFARAASWTNKPSADKLKDFTVTIVGAGFSGLIAAIQLKVLGINFRIIERQNGVGGTWQLNDYPEARVDISTFLYQFKFEKQYPWESYFATQQELLVYIDYILDKYNLRDSITLNTKVTDAQWNEQKKKWQLELEGPDGATESLEPNVVISACGLFSTPKLPDIKGIEDYQGKMFHTTGWDHDFDYTGKRVGVIGTGSTGSQLVRGVAQKAGKLTIYQRTPNWVTPIPGYRNKVPETQKWLFKNMPGYVEWYTYNYHIAQHQMYTFQTIDREWQKNGGIISENNDNLREGLKGYIRKQVGDRDDLYDKLVPKYAPFARRLVVDNDWYKTLMRDNVELDADGIDHITANGIVSKSGEERELDLIVLGAGFQVSKYLYPIEYKGRNGVELDDLWGKDGARAYLTTVMPGYPNFFMLYGPNAGSRTGSFHSWMEIITRYVCDAITVMIESDKQSIEVKHEVFQKYNDDMDKEMESMLWEEERGGGSYYVNEHGRSGVNMPWLPDDFYQMIRRPKADEFKFD